MMDEIDEGFRCTDCRIHTMKEVQEYYMVSDEVWQEAGMSIESYSGMLCIGCLETRLGRLLTAADFPPCRVNAGVFGMSDRMANRLGQELAA